MAALPFVVPGALENPSGGIRRFRTTVRLSEANVRTVILVLGLHQLHLEMITTPMVHGWKVPLADFCDSCLECSWCVGI